jgi:hypothetical protein
MNARLIAADGEVLERIRCRPHGQWEYVVESTGKSYATLEAAKRAAEARHTHDAFMFGAGGAAEREGK